MDVHMESPPPGVPAPIYPSAPTSPDFDLPEILLTIPSGVILYYIDKEGRAVTTLPGATFLQIFRSPTYHELGPDDHPAAYLVVRNGEWSYPLIPRKSPVFLSTSGIFTFPDAVSGGDRHSVAIVFDSGVSEANKKMFKDIVESCGVLRREGDSSNVGSASAAAALKDPSSRSAAETAVLKGADLIGKGIVMGAKAAEYGLQKGAEAAQRRMEPEPGKKVDPKVVKGVELAKKGTRVTKVAAEKVEGWVGGAARAVGRSLAHLVFGKGDGGVGGGGGGGGGTMAQIKWIVKLSLEGLGVVFTGLDEAKEILKSSVKSSTVQIVDYKYGSEAAVVAGVASDAFGNLVDTADAAMGIGLSKKTFAKKMVKKTGKELAKEAVGGGGGGGGGVETRDLRVDVDSDGRYVLCDAPEATPTLGRGRGAGLTAPSPERSRSPLAAASSRQPPARPTSLPTSTSSTDSAGRQRHAQFTDAEVEALLELAPTPTHGAVSHALELTSREERDGVAGERKGETKIYPKL